MTNLTFQCSESAQGFAKLARQAAATWNDALAYLVQLDEAPSSSTIPANIRIVLAYGVQNAAHPTRVAECRHLGADQWLIALEKEVKWGISAWDRFWGRGENALAALVHEMGHVFTLPHASNPLYVMHPEIGGNGKLPRSEKEHYRAKFISILDDE